MLHSRHGIGGTRNIVVYACPNTNRLVCENGYLDEFMIVDDGSGDF